MQTETCTPLMTRLPSTSKLQPLQTLGLSPANRLTVKTALTPTTHESSTPMSYSTMESSFTHDSPSGRSGLSTRLTLPSPSRSRLDRRYAKRLAIPSPVNTSIANTSTPPLAPSSACSSASAPARIVPPPGITRDFSIFRPTPIVTAYSSTSCSSPLHMSPRQHFFPSSRDESASSSHSGSSTSTSRRRIVSRASSDIGTSDRFIPSRATSKMNIDLWNSVNEQTYSGNNVSQPEENNANDAPSNNTGDDTSNSNTGNSVRNTEPTISSQQTLHNVLLRSELLGENINPYSNNMPFNGSHPRMPGQALPLGDGMNRLRFQSPRQAYQDSIFNELTGPTSIVNAFSLTPVGNAASQRLMSAPQKRRRRIAKVPFKVLDAPALQDDFYLNLVDWSSQNVLAVGLGSCVYLWSACTSKVTKLCDLAQSEDIVTSVSWAQRGTHLAVGTSRGEVQLWDTIKCKKVRTMTGHSARVGTLAWTGPTLASGSRDRLIFLRDVRVQSSFTDRLTAHKQEVCGLKWSFDEPSFLASGGNDNQLHVVDSRNPGTPVHRFSDHTAAVKAIAWSPHQHGLLASGGGTADRCIRFWNTLSGSSLSCVDTGSQVCNLAWSQNCNEIVSTHGYSLNQIVVWRYPSLSKVVTLTGHTYRVLYLAVSPDGSTIVTGAGDETLRFWQVFPGPRSDGKNNTGGLLFPNTLGSVIR